MKGNLIGIFIWLLSCVAIFIITSDYFYKRMRAEFERGLMTGADYYNRHGEFPSYWHWNKKFEDPRFDMEKVPPSADSIIIDINSFKGIDSIVFGGGSDSTYLVFRNGKIDTVKIIK